MPPFAELMRMAEVQTKESQSAVQAALEERKRKEDLKKRQQEERERKERELGLRCSDISCGVGPTDEDPIPVIDPRAVRQIHLRPLTGDGNVCEHMFHPACLVSAERVAGWSGADQKREVEGEENVEVSCPVCRAVGCISRVDWDEGACALA